MKILITGGKSAVALKVLKAFANDDVLVADYGEVPSLTSAKYQMISLGEKNEDTIAHRLLNHCLDHGVDALLPLHRFEIEPVAKAEILFNEFNVNVLLPKMDQLQEFLNPARVKEHWGLVSNGQLLYSTLTESVVLDASLDGAFFIEREGVDYQLSLITI